MSENINGLTFATGRVFKKFQSVDLNTFEWASGPPSNEEYNAYVNRLKGEWIGNEDFIDLEDGEGKHLKRYSIIHEGNVLNSFDNMVDLNNRLRAMNGFDRLDVYDNKTKMIIKSK